VLSNGSVSSKLQLVSDVKNSHLPNSEDGELC
jgi:hypothetical protein